MVVNASNALAFRACRNLQSLLPATPFTGSSFFGGQFMSSLEAATCRQEQLSQVRCLASTGSRGAQGAQAPKAAPQSHKRWAPHSLPPAALAAPQAVEVGFCDKRVRHCGKKGNGPLGLTGTIDSAPGSARCQREGVPLNSMTKICRPFCFWTYKQHFTIITCRF